MTSRVSLRGAAVAAVPLASIAAGLPWWAVVLLSLAGAFVAVTEPILRYRLGVQALDKANPDQIVELIAAVNGNLPMDRREAK